MKNRILQKSAPLSILGFLESFIQKNGKNLIIFLVFTYFSLPMTAQVVCIGEVSISADPTTCSATIDYANIFSNPPAQPGPVTIFDSQHNIIFSGFLPTSLSNVMDLRAYRIDYDGGLGNGGCSTNLSLRYPQGCISEPPIILIPTQGSVMDNGCSDGSNAINWHFEWTAVQGAVSYFINVRNVNIPFDIINFRTDNLTPPTAYDADQPYPDLYGYQTGWECKARAVFSDGSFSDWSPIVNFTLEPVNTDCQSTIISAQDGDWSAISTWVGGAVPTANNDVIIAHTVTNGGTSPSTVKCRNLTINGGGKLNQSNQLNISGNLTILANGIFDNNPTNQYYPFSYTNIGTLDAFGNLTAADDKLVTISGTLRLGYNNSSLSLGGRIVFNTGSTFSLEGPLNLKGWSGSTPQYLLDIDNLTNLNLPNGNTAEIYLPTYANGNIQRAISTGRSLATPCRSLPSALVRMGSNNWFGSNTAARQVIRSIMINNSLPAINVNFENTAIGYSIFKNVNVNSNNSEFSDFSIDAGTSLFGDYTIVNHCNGVAPSLWASAAFDARNISSFKINVTDSAVLRLFDIQTIGGSFKIQKGIVVVKNGTLDLRNTSVSGLTNTQYFVTKSGGAVLLPAIGATPVTFNVGISIPNGNNPPTSIYAPVGVVSNSGNTNITVNLETLTVPSGYIAPTIQWNITPSGGSPNLNITFTWPPSAESVLFANNRSLAKIFHFNSSTMLWEELLTSVLVMNSDGSFSLTANNVVNFSPFAVMIPESVLSTELILFSAKANDNQAEFNWQTATETNVKNFDIEKSLDGQKFEKIAEVKANNTPSVYQAFDHQFLESAYYRLKINDLDGTTNHSKTVFLEKNGAKTIKISRNTEGGIFIETDDIIESVIVTNNIGQVLKTTKGNRFGLTDLPAGIYIISVKTNKSFVSQKILNF